MRRRLAGALVGLAALLAVSLPAGAATTAILPGGPPVVVDVPAAGDTGTATFTAAAGDRVSVEVTDVTIGTSACCSAKVSLVRPDGRTLTSLTVGTNGGFIDATLLPLDGEYSLVVDPSSTNTGSATLTLHAVPPDVSAAAAIDGPSVSVDLSAPGQNARVLFDGTAGQRVSVEAGGVSIGPSVCCSARLTLVKPDGKTLASTSFGTNGGFLDATTLPATGTYTLLVDPQGPSSGSALLTVHEVPADAAATIVPGGAPVTVMTSVPGQNARLSFAGATGQRVALELTGVCCTTTVTLLRPDGKTLASASAGTFGGFLDATSLPLTGTYTIVADLQGAATGSITFALFDVPADASGTIVPGGPAVTVATAVPGQNARLTFGGTNGQRVSLSVGPTCCSARITILKPNGATLVGPVTASSFGGFVDATELPSTGTYTIVVDPQGAASGSMTLTLFDVPADATGTIAPGGPAVTVTAGVPGQNARLTFDGTANQRVSVRIGPTCCSVRVSLQRSSGSTVASVNTGTNGGFLDATALPVSGTYSLVVDPQGVATGSVTLTLFDVPADVSGTIVPGGAPLTVTTATPGQDAEITFAGTANQRVSLGVSGSCCTASLSLERPDGSTLASMTTFGSSGFLDTQRLPVTGTYTIVVDLQGAATGSMTLTLYDVPDDVTGAIVPDGPSVTATMGTPGQNARLTFTGAAGERVSLEISGVTIGSTVTGTRVALLRPDGTELAAVVVGTNGGVIDPVTLPLAGTYTVLVDPQGANTGSATVTLHDVPGDVTASIVPGGAPVTVTTFSAGQNALVSFTGAAGQRVSLALADASFGSSTCCGARVSVLEPGGATLVAAMSFGTSGGFVDTVTLPADGTYTILLDPQGTATGSVTLTLYDVPADASAAATPGGAAVTVTTSTPGQNAAVTFSGAVGQRVSVKIGPTCCITRIRVLAPGGAVVFGPTSFGAGGGFVDTLSLLADGTYTVELDPSGQSVGGVTATVYDVPADVVGTLATGSSTSVTTSVPGQNARVTFDAPADVGVKLTVGPFNCCSTKISIENPDGSLLAGPTSFNPDGGSLLTRLGAAGTYAVVVDPQGTGTGVVHLALELDTTAPAPPTLTLTESAPDAHVSGPTFFYRPGGPGGSFLVGATSSDLGAGLQKVRFPGLGSGFAPGVAVDDTLSPYSQTYTWTTAATYESPANLVTAFDRVGNTSSTPFAVVADSTPPLTSDNTAAIGSAWKNTTQIVVLTAADGAGSGSGISYSTTDGSTPTTASPQGTSVMLSAEGVYTVRYFSVDNVGNAESPRTAGTQIRLDLTKPSSAVLDPLPATIRNGQVLTGSGADALSGLASVAYYYCAGSSCTPSVLVGSSGAGPTYPVTWTAQPADGTYQLVARAVDAAGNTLDSAKRTVTIDNTAPNTTVSSGPANPTNQTGATFSFTSTEAGSTFECSLDGAAFALCTSPKSYSGLTAGAHTFQVRATDPVGNTDATPASFGWTIDLTAPDTTITSGPSSPTNATTASFSFTSTEAGSSFQCSLDGGAFASCTTPKSYSGLTAGAHTFQVRATDPAGNTDPTPASHGWTIDTSAPDTTITSGPLSPTNATTASFSFTASEAGSTFECRVDGGAFAACTAPKTYSGLTAGSHTFEVRAVDTAANVDPTPASFTWTVDLAAPDTTVTAGPANPTNQTSATFSFTSTEAGSTFQCRLDGAAFAACTSPRSYSALGEGAHTFEVRATDPAGNTDATPASFSWTVDTSAPDTTITSGPPSPTSSTTASFSFTSTEAGSSFQCSLDGGAFAACTSPKSYGGLADGAHTMQVRATDPAGNTDPAPGSFGWTVDTAAPDTTIASGPASPTNATTASFSFTSTEAGSTFECRLDGAAFAACTSPKSYSGLTAGSHIFDVRALDAAGNPDPTPASLTWTVDLTAPDTSVTSGPSTPTGQTSATFSFTATEAGSTFECSLDGAAFALCTSPKSYSGLGDGAHAFQVRATDPAGNTDATPASFGWTVDTAAPETTITSHPADPTNLGGASFAFVSDDPSATFQCRLDGASFAACTSPKVYTGLAAGSHAFEVRALDTAGNPDPTPAAFAWTVDTTPPDTSLISTPANPTNQTSASFSFASEPGATFECNLDGAGYTGCASPFGLSGLAAGSHTFQVRATDAAGNVDPTPASHTWTVDLAAPETAIGGGPAGATSSTAATFDFSANEAGSTFECRLDGAAFAPCSSPKTYSGLAEGAHGFEVRATDPAGNTDATPASRSWTVDVTAPGAPAITSPADGSVSASATVSVSGTAEPGASVEVFDGAVSKGFTTASGAGSWTKALTGLADGAHALTARASDPAGNTSPASASVTVTVDTAAPNTIVTTGPLGSTSSTSASFTFSADEAGATFECSLDGAAFAPCVSPKTYGGLTESAHSFQVRATDSAGNTDPTPASRSWTVDVTAPGAPVITSPADGSVSASATVSLSGTAEAGASLEVFDGAVSKGFATAGVGGSWTKALTGLADGSHSFTARASDAAGNSSPPSASVTVTVDTTAPQTTITASPSDPTRAADAVFDFAADEAGATFECSLDGAAFAPCTGPKTYSGLAEGAHSFQVRATDSAGNTDPTPASRSWTVDRSAPETTILSGPADPSSSTDATFDFTASEAGSSFECSLDGAAFAACTTPFTATGLASGLHTFDVRATDAAGNADATPAAYTWTVS